MEVRGEFWILEEKKEGGAGGVRGEETDQLKSLSVGAVAGDAVVFGYGLVKCGGNVQEPSATKL